jgi:hypothetical protein
LTQDIRPSSASSLSTAGLSEPTTSRCLCAWFPIHLQSKYAFSLHLICMVCAFSVHFVCIKCAYQVPLVPVCLQTVCSNSSMSTCINHKQVRMDYVLFIPPPTFFGDGVHEVCMGLPPDEDIKQERHFIHKNLGSAWLLLNAIWAILTGWVVQLNGNTTFGSCSAPINMIVLRQCTRLLLNWWCQSFPIFFIYSAPI